METLIFFKKHFLEETLIQQEHIILINYDSEDL